MKKKIIEEGLEVLICEEPEKFGIKKDEYGPDKIIIVNDSILNYKGILVIDNVWRGPGIGGIRMRKDVNITEVYSLARAMTKKNSAADIPHGGGKSGIILNPNIDWEKKKEVLRRFANAIKEFEEYIPGPDMGTNEECMEIVYKIVGRACGLPERAGGIPLDEIGITGYGVTVSAEATTGYPDWHGIDSLEDKTVAIQGFGAVGAAAAKEMEKRGAEIIAISTSEGGLLNLNGLNVSKLLKLKKEYGIDRLVNHYDEAVKINKDSILYLPVDFLIPAAIPNVITEKNVNYVNAKIIVSGANIPITPKVEEILYKKGILVVPDFIANAGGVICASMEVAYLNQGLNPEQIKSKYPEVYNTVYKKIYNNTKEIIERSIKQNINPTKAAEEIAWERVKKAKPSL